MSRKIGVLGLGYVGLPVAVAIAKKFPNTVGFDINKARVAELQRGVDRNNDIDTQDLQKSPICFSSDVAHLQGLDFFIVAVPTPIDIDRRPDLRALGEASRLVGSVIRPGAIVVYESTVYPGVTEEYCGPIIAKTSGLTQGKDFKLGYSPERINPGDRQHTLERIVKVVSAEDQASLEVVCAVYGAIVSAGLHRASSIKVAEAAKVIENTQRDLNIALMNELALIFERIGISTKDVLEAAKTKWNFLPFSPGLVGGHCIGVDPYYLTSKAEQLGYLPQVITAGRRINDGMGQYVAQLVIKKMAQQGVTIRGARVGILGLTFKENINDIRNSRVPTIVSELDEFGVKVLVHDPFADMEEALEEYAIQLVEESVLSELDALILAVTHQNFMAGGARGLENKLRPGGILMDVKSAFSRGDFAASTQYCAL